jgi:hypothetical protein
MKHPFPIIFREIKGRIAGGIYHFERAFTNTS